MVLKSNGTLNKKHQYQPYNESDPIDYLIFEIGGTIDNPICYRGNFCVIPFYVLLERGFLRQNTSDGKTSLSICTPDYKDDHWTKAYWNKFDPVTKDIYNKKICV